MYTQTPVSVTNRTLEGEYGVKAVLDMKLSIVKSAKLIMAVAPGVAYEKYQLSLKEMKYKTLLMNLNGLPFPLKGDG